MTEAATERTWRDPTEGPNGCRGALIVAGEHFWCELQWPHPGLGHSNTAALALWLSHDEHEIDDARRARKAAQEAAQPQQLTSEEPELYRVWYWDPCNGIGGRSEDKGLFTKPAAEAYIAEHAKGWDETAYRMVKQDVHR